MKHTEASVAREAKAMTRQEVIKKAMDGAITWAQAASICRVSYRQMARLRERYERLGFEGLRDGRTGKRQPSRIPVEVEQEVVRLKREIYGAFSVRHFYEMLKERHCFRYGYTWTLTILQKHGLADKAAMRGQYRRKRERRPMRGMLLHLDASRHEWIAGLPMQDLNVVLDDADGRILFARFVPEEGTRSTLEALEFVVRRWGRFCELYTDRASHFCRTTDARLGPDAEQHGQVTRVCEALGIRQILARSPEARGRSERCFGTLQGRLPQELALEGITTYAQANEFLAAQFVPRFNARFTVEPPEPQSAFVSIKGIDLSLLLSIQHERKVQADNTVRFEGMTLQIPRGDERLHYARCVVLVHRFLDDTIGISFHGKLIAHFNADGAALAKATAKRTAEAA
jgi:transposase